MSIIGIITALFKADTSQFDAGTKKVEGHLDRLKKHSGFGEMLAGQRQTVAMLKGAGAMAGITLAIQRATAGLREFNDINIKVAEGAMSAAEGIEAQREALLKALPVFGSGWQLGREIREAITGEEAADAAAAAKLLAQSAAETAEAMARIRHAQAIQKTGQALGDIQTKMKQARQDAFAFTMEPVAREALDARREFEATIAALDKMEKQLRVLPEAMIGNRAEGPLAKIAELREQAAALAADRERAAKMQEDRDIRKAVEDRASSVFESLKTPEERFREGLAETATQLRLELLDPATAGRRVKQLRDELAGSMKVGGGRAAVLDRANQSIRALQVGRTPQERAAEVANDLLKQIAKDGGDQTKWLQRILDSGGLN